ASNLRNATGCRCGTFRNGSRGDANRTRRCAPICSSSITRPPRCGGPCRRRLDRPGGRSHVAVSMFQRYCWLGGLVAGLAAAGFGLGAQKSGSAVMYSFGALLIFALTANSVLSLLMTMSEASLLYRAKLSAPKASAMLMADGGGAIDLSE